MKKYAKTVFVKKPEPSSKGSQQPQVLISSSPGLVVSLFGLISAAIGFFMFAILMVPLALILSGIGINKGIKGNYFPAITISILGLLIGFIGILNSPSIHLATLGLWAYFK